MAKVAQRAPLSHAKRRTAFLAGDAVITLHNPKTQKRFTYRITQCDDKPTLFFVALLTGANNTEDFQYLGCIRDNVYTHGRKSRIGEDAPSAKAFAWTWENLDRLPANLEIWHEGFCLRCHRTLTVPDSIASGFGPECIKKVQCAT